MIANKTPILLLLLIGVNSVLADNATNNEQRGLTSALTSTLTGLFGRGNQQSKQNQDPLKSTGNDLMQNLPTPLQQLGQQASQLPGQQGLMQQLSNNNPLNQMGNMMQQTPFNGMQQQQMMNPLNQMNQQLGQQLGQMVLQNPVQEILQAIVTQLRNMGLLPRQQGVQPNSQGLFGNNQMMNPQSSFGAQFGNGFLPFNNPQQQPAGQLDGLMGQFMSNPFNQGSYQQQQPGFGGQQSLQGANHQASQHQQQNNQQQPPQQQQQHANNNQPRAH